MSKIRLHDFDAVCLCAPTASGKTDLAYKMCAQGASIVSVDSALVYHGMDIGTAKPSKDMLKRYPHYLVDIVNPDTPYSVAHFINDAKNAIADIRTQGKTPLLVGGTTLYFDAMIRGLSDLPPSDPAIMADLQDTLAHKGLGVLYQQLIRLDPATRLHAHDTQRILRALCVCLQTGMPFSQLQNAPKKNLVGDEHWLFLALMPDRAMLHTRIETRLEAMWQAGFLHEARTLLAYYGDAPSLRAVGYRQACDFLRKHPYAKNPCQNTKNLALYATRQLAKRQCTWLKQFYNNPTKTTTLWFDAPEKIEKLLFV